MQLDINFENWFFAPTRRWSNINVKGLKIYRLNSHDVGRYLNDFMKTLSVSDFNRNFQNYNIEKSPCSPFCWKEKLFQISYMFAKLKVSMMLYLLAKWYVRFLYNYSVGCLSNETHFLCKYLCKPLKEMSK